MPGTSVLASPRALLIAGLILWASPAAAVPTTIQFNITSPISSPYQEAGFDFNATSFGGNPLGFTGPFVNNFAGTNGSPSIVTMTGPAGQMWDVLQMEIANWNSTIGSNTLDFTGTQFDGTTVNRSLVTTGFTTVPETVVFSGFTNLTQFTYTTWFTSFDNLVVDNIQPIPEPNTFALTAAGLLAVGLLRRRR